MYTIQVLDTQISEHTRYKTFSKCYVGRNGKQNQQNYTYKCVDRSRHNGIKGVKAKCAH